MLLIRGLIIDFKKHFRRRRKQSEEFQVFALDLGLSIKLNFVFFCSLRCFATLTGNGGQTGSGTDAGARGQSVRERRKLGGSFRGRSFRSSVPQSSLANEEVS